MYKKRKRIPWCFHEIGAIAIAELEKWEPRKKGKKPKWKSPKDRDLEKFEEFLKQYEKSEARQETTLEIFLDHEQKKR